MENPVSFLRWKWYRREPENSWIGNMTQGMTLNSAMNMKQSHWTVQRPISLNNFEETGLTICFNNIRLL